MASSLEIAAIQSAKTGLQFISAKCYNFANPARKRAGGAAFQPLRKQGNGTADIGTVSFGWLS